MPKVSVIVPVYNTELYVERAIISLMEQTLDDVQFIIIDDGSKDNSLNIIKQVIAHYPARTGQVTLISRENRGVAATRAQGMELVTGDYVIHLDSDDWAELNWLEAMYTKAIEENADVVVCDYSNVYANKSIYQSQEIVGDGQDCVNKMLIGQLHGSTWNKLIRNSVIVTNNVVFPQNINYLEDFIFIAQIFLVSKKIEHVVSSLVNYNKTNESSITASINDHKIKEIIAATNIIYHIISQFTTSTDLLSSLDVFKLNQKNWIVHCNREKTSSYMWSIYPESKKTILSTSLPIHIKIILYIGSHGWCYFANTLINVVEVLRKIIR